MKCWIILFLILLINVNNLSGQQKYDTAKPWAIWWWMGSAVDTVNISKQLNDFSEAGIGGVNIVPVYGAKGYEEKFLPFLSEDWMKMVGFTINKANELNLGVDMTPGTGWPLGGKWMNEEDAAKRLIIHEIDCKDKSIAEINIDSLKKELNAIEILSVIERNGKNHKELLTEIEDGIIHMDLSNIQSNIIVFALVNTMQQVKRAAPGGEGLVMDYFDSSAVNNYFMHLDSVFENSKFKIMPHAYYHDSYEVFKASWTKDFENEFIKLNGYNVIDKLYLLVDSSNAQRKLLMHDIRITIDELLCRNFAQTYTRWCKNHNALSRYQAHGSPANILDLYELADIPETESFGCSEFSIPGLSCDADYNENMYGRPNPLMMKLASSPAHLSGKELVSSESATWLGNHFRVSLKSIKPQLDELFISGINHIFYHGITYSPQEAEYPGWLFYASTNFGQSSHFWDELPHLNAYVERCQKRLQNSKPDNDILLYFSLDDFFTEYDYSLVMNFDIHGYKRWFSNSEFGKLASGLWQNGFTFDYISDRQLERIKLDSEKNLFLTEGTKYKVILVPPLKYINKQTLKKIEELASQGAHVVFANKLPEHYAGMLNVDNTEINDLKARMKKLENVYVIMDVNSELQIFNLSKEKLKQKGLDFIRKTTPQGKLYFVSNLGNQFTEDSIVLNADYNYIEVYDPLSAENGCLQTNSKFYLNIPPGKSYFIQTHAYQPDLPEWKNPRYNLSTRLDHEWKVEFIKGNLENLEKKYVVDSLTSWTKWDDPALQSFCGKAKYSTTFKLSEEELQSKAFKLTFDDIRETAAIKINGVDCGLIWALPFELRIPKNILKKNNSLEVIVQNLSANYIKKVDSVRPEWKSFYDINFVDITYKPFDASAWRFEPSGIIGNAVLQMEH